MKMTREEAIQNREDCLKYLEGIGKKASPGCVEAMRWSVKALKAFRPVSREQVEKYRGEWQICFEDWRKQMAGDQCSKCGFQHYGTSINHYKFCPF